MNIRNLHTLFLRNSNNLFLRNSNNIPLRNSNSLFLRNSNNISLRNSNSLFLRNSNNVSLRNSNSLFLRNLKRIILFDFLIFIVLFLICPICLADESPAVSNVVISKKEQYTEPFVYSKHAILMSSDSGQILYEHDAYTKTFPASTTKLMTAILTLENCRLDDEVIVSKEALLGIPRSYTTAALQAGEKLSVDQLLHVLLIPSANDAANALACHISGSVDNFSVLMNAKAKELGCLNTNFVNPNGVHNDNHYSTAYDLALIGKYATTFETIREIAKETSCALPDLPDGKTRIFKSTNTLINPKNQYYYESATGLKTGYTEKAKSCIVATATKDDKNLLCVILGGDKTEEQKAQRELDCKSLFEFGFNQFTSLNLCTENSAVDVSKVDIVPSCLQDANLSYSQTLNLMVPNIEEVVPVFSFNDNIELPILKGTVLGNVTYSINGSNYTVDVVASEDVLSESEKGVKNGFYILIVAFLLILVVTIFKRKPREPKYFKRSLY